MAAATLPEANEDLVGEVAAVVFANDATGFAVVEVSGPGGSGSARASGPLAGLVPGQPVRLVGRWTDHHRYGPTFAAVFYELVAPRSEDGLAAFLASDRFPGVGDRLSRRLVEVFGLDLGAVVEAEPERLAQVRGVSRELARRIGQAWQDAGVLAALVQRLGSVGLPAATAQGLHRRFGDTCGDVLDANPYAVLEVRGVRWSHADRLAAAAGLDQLDARRLAAGAVAAQQQRAEREGHTCVADGELLHDAARLLDVDAVDARRGIEQAQSDGHLVAASADTGSLWYRPAELAAEEGLAAALLRLHGASSRVRAAAHTPTAGLTAEQEAAVTAALSTPVSVLTGGPGTGKTHALVAVVRACEAAGLRVALCAPTGRAAKRLEELTGRPATTVHRLLDAQPVADASVGDGFRFSYGPDRRLPQDLIVADEWSMADTRLACALVQAVDDGAHLLLVGDADQLPSVGPGAVLRDLLHPAVEPIVPATTLRQIHRQAAASRIVTLAHEINAGTAAEPRGRQHDVFTVPQQAAGLTDRVAEIVAVRAPAFFGCAPADVQVLAPMYRGRGGVDRLNARLKERLNPPAGRPAVAGFHEGDRVVQTRNDAELDVANGDVGEVAATDPAARTLEVAFPHGSVTYDAQRSGDLRPAFCLTVHKAQGGEWPVVILALDPGHRAMLWRELVYTAVTRARDGLLLVGDPSLIPFSARRTGSGARRRRTLLVQRLTAGLS